MNIILRELRANLKGLIIWIVCIAVFVVLAGAEFSSFNAASNIDQMMNAFPPAIRNALSIDLVRLDRPAGRHQLVAGRDDTDLRRTADIDRLQAC